MLACKESKRNVRKQGISAKMLGRVAKPVSKPVTWQWSRCKCSKVICQGCRSMPRSSTTLEEAIELPLHCSSLSAFSSSLSLSSSISCTSLQLPKAGRASHVLYCVLKQISEVRDKALSFACRAERALPPMLTAGTEVLVMVMFSSLSRLFKNGIVSASLSAGIVANVSRLHIVFHCRLQLRRFTCTCPNFDTSATMCSCRMTGRSNCHRGHMKSEET